MPDKKQNTAAVCEALAEATAREMGLTIWDVVFEKEGAGWYLRYYIDTDEGVTIDECEAFSRRVSDMLDQADPISQGYCLEVSSPGIERKFTRPWHFQSYMGATVLARLIRPVEGRRDFVGELTGYDEESGLVTLALEDDGLEMTFAPAETAYVRLCDTDI